MTLSDAERAQLLRVARCSIDDAVRGGNSLGAAREALPPGAYLAARRGVFVTLLQPRGDDVASGRRLRGCLGSIEADRPLPEAVASTAAAAAMRDPRFPPLAQEELATLCISISVLTPMQPAGRVEEIELGRHGLQLVRGEQRSVFLPQVALEQGWTRDQLLAQLAIKAGLPGDGWLDARLSKFETEAFSES